MTQTIYTSLKDKVVFVTGGASGIGESIVTHFCLQGAKVAFVDLMVEEGNALTERLGATEGVHKPLFIPLDLRDIAALQNAIERVGKEFGNITVLVNNAAHDEMHKVEDTTVEYWDDRINVNLRHVFFAAQAVIPQMKTAGGGSIINFGSISWMMAEGGFPGYTASKAAIHGVTRGLARDFGPDRIRVNTIIPGWVMTKKQLENKYDEAGEKFLQIRQCLQNHVKAHDIAYMTLFLASDDSAMCTSQNYSVDAGWI